MRTGLKIGLVSLLAISSVACPGTKSGGSGLLSLDETKTAGDTVLAANQVLREIKKRFKENEPRVAELQQALKDKDPQKVRVLADGLVTEIDAGMASGRDAAEKIRAARDLNINDDYRNYLDLKITALEMYVRAFEERRQAAIILRDGYDPKNAARREEVVASFMQREEKFREVMDEAREISEQANDLARESLIREKRGK